MGTSKGKYQVCDVFVQDAVVTELKRKTRQIREKKVLNRDEVYHGALEDILLGENRR